jgi:hypothetical protein
MSAQIAATSDGRRVRNSVARLRSVSAAWFPFFRRDGAGVAGAAADPCGELSFGAEVVNVDAQPPVHRAALHDGVAGAGSSDQSVRCDQVDADEYSTLAAGRNGQVTTDEKGEPTEHLRLSDAGLVDEELTDALGEIVVVDHGAILR